MTTHHTSPENSAVAEHRWSPLPSGVEITIIPVVDRQYEGLFARLNYDEALAVAARYDARLPTEAEILELGNVGLQLMPYLGTPTAETDIKHSRLHDDDVWRQLEALKWDEKQPVSGAGKHWIDGAPAGKSRLMGWDKDGDGPGKALWQPPQVAHNRLHFDDGTTTLLVRDKRDPADDVTNSEPTESMHDHPTIRRGSDDEESVKCWQQVLITAQFSLYPYGADGDFGQLTHQRTKEYQRSRGLTADGIVGPITWGTVDEPIGVPEPERTIPSAPFPPLVGGAARAKAFGTFSYVSAPTRGNPEAIRITDGWARKNIERVSVPQLASIPGVEYKGHRVGKGPASGSTDFYAPAAKQLQALWQAWDDEGLLPLVLTWAGSYSPRFIRGSRRTLSNHAYGTAFDINASWNWLGAEPADWDERGTVKPLIALMHEHGFYSGIHFSRKDAMHVEIAKIL